MSQEIRADHASRITRHAGFSGLFGVDQQVKSLQRALAADELAGAYLFVGPQGIGKTALANAFAAAATCLNPRRDPFDACGECESCRRVVSGTQPEIVLISPAGDQTQIWQFWDRDGRPPGILQHTLPFAPTIGRKRVYIVERADTLNEPTANSLLKVLEEPPPYALFVLLSPHASRMLPTILSRSQVVRLLPAPVDDLALWLQKTNGVETDNARTFAAYAEGRAGTALRMASSPGVEAEIGSGVALAASLATYQPIRALRLGEQMRQLAAGLKAVVETELGVGDGGKGRRDDKAKSGGADRPPLDDSAGSAPKERVGRRPLGIVLDLLAVIYRDLLALCLAGEAAPIVHTAYRAELVEAARRRTPEAWMGCIDAILIARRRADQNASIPLLTDSLSVTLVNM